jgi:CubicO group peptidase (beta-lactamase class C family)
MSRWIKAISLLCLLIAGQTFQSCSRLSASTTIRDAQLDDIDAHFQALAERHDFSGALLIAAGDEIRLSEGYGWANIEQEVNNTPQTSFYIGSLTKQFTAVAVLILHHRGEFELSDTVCDYIPDCPDHWREITIHQLLTHTSGLPEIASVYADRNLRNVEYSIGEVVRWFMEPPLDFPPGDHFAYSNTGYQVLGYLIEEVSGQSYDSFLQQEIFDPLGMNDSGYLRDENELATGYRWYEQTAGWVNATLASSAGGLYSTAEDLLSWVRALQNGTIIPQALFDQMLSTQVTFDEYAFAPLYENLGYGYAWFTGTRFGHEVVGHGGSYEGFRALIEYYPDEDITIVVLTNLESASLSATTYPTEVIFGPED